MSVVLRAVVEHAPDEIEEYEARAIKLRIEAAECDRLATVLREVLVLAGPHVERPGQLKVVKDEKAA